MSGAERLSAAFEGRSGRALFMPYMMGGFPTQDAARAIAEAYIAHGAGVIELGVPFSDPLADGPVIHAAAVQALAAGATTQCVLDLAGAIAERIPVVVMAYINNLLAYGLENFLDALAQRQVCGLLVPDLPFEEEAEVWAACAARGVVLIPLVAPTTTSERMAKIAAVHNEGFVYAVSVTGTTGERSELSEHAEALIERIRAHTQLPIALGFGIGTPAQASAAAEIGADGVIVGSRLVRAVGESADPATAAGDVVAAITAALR